MQAPKILFNHFENPLGRATGVETKKVSLKIILYLSKKRLIGTSYLWQKWNQLSVDLFGFFCVVGAGLWTKETERCFTRRQQSSQGLRHSDLDSNTHSAVWP